LIEQAMIFALGFFVAGLLALLFLPAVQRRAARLAGRRLEMLLPLSMEEIVAERDQLRAEFAVGQRRIEQKLEAAADAQAIHMAEIGRQAAAIRELEGQLGETRDELRGVGQARDALQREQREAEATIAAIEKALHDEGAFHAATREGLEGLRAEHLALEQVAHERRAAVAGLETRAASLDLRIMALNHQKEELERNLQARTSEAEVLQVERDLARAEREGLETKRVTLQRRLDEEALRAADLRDQIEALRRRAEEADRTRVAGEQTRHAAEQRHAQAAKKVEEQEERIRSLQAAAAERHAAQVAEIATLGGQLETARREHASLKEERRARESDAARKLEAEIARARAAEAEWRSRHERQAAEIAALGAALEQARQHHAGTQQETGERERQAQTKLSDAQTRARDAEAEWQSRHEKQAAEIAALSAALEEARQRHAPLEQDSHGGEAEVQSRLEGELKKAREAEAEWQARHTSQRSDIAGLVTFLEEAQREKGAAQSGVAAAAAAPAAADLSISQREETALLRQAIADLGSEVVRIASALKGSDAQEDGASMPPDVMEVRERRGRARAQP
jgi:chromosome segregation ATPase